MYNVLIKNEDGYLFYQSRWLWLSCVLPLLYISCKPSLKFSYEDISNPVYEGNYIVKDIYSERKELKVASFNIEFANKMEEAVNLLQSEELGDVDVLLLQEMDEAGTDLLARALNMAYVYYPAIFHPGQKKNVGNAVLSKRPILEHRKLKLPHPSLYPIIRKMKTYHFRKMATIAGIDVNGKMIYFYSSHGAAFNPSKNRKGMSEAFLNDAKNHGYTHCVVGGDFNSVGEGDINSISQVFTADGFSWPSKNLGRTIMKIRWFISFFPKKAFAADHIFAKGFETIESGKVNNHNVSDHMVIWANLSEMNENN